MAASSKDKRTPFTTPPYQVPSVDVTLDPPTFSLDTTFKESCLNKTAHVNLIVAHIQSTIEFIAIASYYTLFYLLVPFLFLRSVV
jgi:hypothetical protein